jgi:hypothetical protein
MHRASVLKPETEPWIIAEPVHRHQQSHAGILSGSAGGKHDQVLIAIAPGVVRPKKEKGRKKGRNIA